jgi:precorrin-2 dehydrogenase/sirohydrochlorin ferrochelatase
MHYYPIFLDVRGRWAVVVGGGRVAERRVRKLLRAGARVYVISPDLTPGLARLAKLKKIHVVRRRYRRGDLYGRGGAGKVPRRWPLLVFAATDDASAQKAVFEDAQALGALVNTADNPSRCDFIVPASFTRGDLQVAISTSGASPALARLLRRQLQATLGEGYCDHVRRLRESRRQVLASVPAQKERAKTLREMARKIKDQKAKGKNQQ